MFSRIFLGRNGPDQLSLALTVLAFVINIIPGGYITFGISLAVLAFAVFRMFSRDIARRQKENFYFINLVNRIKMWYHNKKARRQQLRFYRIFVCPKCGQKLRVPKGKGKVAIKCSRCGERIIKNT